MPIKNIKIIIGSNYGDEGKGLATDYFCNPSEKWLGVLTNGTSQRAHTVDTIDGKHHVFSHFSSGTFQGADTYISINFAINLVGFEKSKTYCCSSKLCNSSLASSFVPQPPLLRFLSYLK